MTDTVDVYKDTAGEWRWRLKAANGRIIADSGEGYRTKWNAKRAARRALAELPITDLAPTHPAVTEDTEHGVHHAPEQ